MKKLMCVLTFAFLTLLPGAAFAESPELIAVKFHADWCGSCKVIGNAMTDLSNKLDDEKVLFVELDYTNNTTEHQAQMMGHALGLGAVLEAHAGKTGFIVLVDNKGQVRDTLTSKMSVKEMSKRIQEQLSP